VSEDPAVTDQRSLAELSSGSDGRAAPRWWLNGKRRSDEAGLQVRKELTAVPTVLASERTEQL
jgi:hypothetical protein